MGSWAHGRVVEVKKSTAARRMRFSRSTGVGLSASEVLQAISRQRSLGAPSAELPFPNPLPVGRQFLFAVQVVVCVVPHSGISDVMVYVMEPETASAELNVPLKE